MFSVRSFAFSRFTPGYLFSTTVESTMLNCFSYKRLFYRMNDALDMIPSDNDSTDSEEEVETGCCKILICSRKSAALSPGKQSDRVSLLSTHWQKQGLNAMMLSICLSVCPFVRLSPLPHSDSHQECPISFILREKLTRNLRLRRQLTRGVHGRATLVTNLRLAKTY